MIVTIAIFTFINDVAEQTIFEKNFLVRDISLVINTLYAAPGEVSYNYIEDTGEFTLEFTKNKITIYKEKEKSNTNIFYLFSENKNKPFNHKILNPKKAKISFVKSENSLDINQK